MQGAVIFLADKCKRESTSTGWNPWHGCTKISPGCKYCYVYRLDKRHGADVESSLCKKNQTFDLPVKRNRYGRYKVPSGSTVFTCFTSDFLLEDADEWRSECWRMIKERSDCFFCFFTKRIDRLEGCLPDDWGNGYDNVSIGCTVENQDRADFRLPVFKSLAIKHKSIIVAPILERVDVSAYLDGTIAEVSVGGESGFDARICDYDWVLDLRRQCEEKNVPFCFHQTGAHFRRDGKVYNIPRKLQRSQARKAGINLPGGGSSGLKGRPDRDQITLDFDLG